MEWEYVVSMVVPVVFILTVGGVLVLRPITKRLGILLEAMAQEKARMTSDELGRLREATNALHDRLSLIEERQDYTERLIGRQSESQD